MNDFDSVIDNNTEKIEYIGGAIRDNQSDKLRIDLIPEYSLYRLARHYQNGAKKYAERNWEKGLPLSTFIASAKRHLMMVDMGDKSEDHEIAVAWNMFGLAWTKRMIEIGELPPELDDVSYTHSINKLMITNE